MPGLAERALGSRLPWIAARRAADRLILEEIAAHRASPEGREDILALLIAAGGEDGAPLSDEELRDQVMTLLVAGHETTSTTLAWCFERLQRHPRCLARLQEEIAGEQGDAYLDAVVNETLRTRPVIDQAVRTLTGPTEIGGYTLPARTTVAASIRSWRSRRSCVRRSDACACGRRARRRSDPSAGAGSRPRPHDAGS